MGQTMNFVIPFSVFLVTFVSGLLFRKIVLARLARHAARTKTKLDDIVVEAIRAPLVLWFLMLGIYFGVKASVVPVDIVEVASRILGVLGITSATMVLSSISVNGIKAYSQRLEGSFPVTSLTQNIARIAIFGTGALIVLNYLGVSIAPILATLGIGGLAVALALQDTLSNLFAGFHVAVTRQVKVGDYIKLESGPEGYVTDITWRTTKIKMLPNNVVLVPNAKLSAAVVTNYHLPDKELAVSVEMGVHYDSDLNKVEAVTLDVARQVLKTVKGAVADFEPSIRYGKFGDFSINFTVGLRAREFTDQYLIVHEFIKALHARYKQEGIVIPYPIQAINTTQEKSGVSG